MTLQEAKDQVAVKHHWNNWGEILNTGMDEGMLSILADQAAELYAASKEDELLEVILDCYTQGTSSVNKDGKELYDHGCLSTYESAQYLLIERGKLKPEQCYRP